MRELIHSPGCAAVGSCLEPSRLPPTPSLRDAYSDCQLECFTEYCHSINWKEAPDKSGVLLKHTHTNTLMHVNTYTHMHVHTQIHIHAKTHMHVHIQTHARIHANTTHTPQRLWIISQCFDVSHRIQWLRELSLTIMLNSLFSFSVSWACTYDVQTISSWTLDEIHQQACLDLWKAGDISYWFEWLFCDGSNKSWLENCGPNMTFFFFLKVHMFFEK